MTKIVNTRIQYNHDTSTAWNETTKPPLEGEILFYTQSGDVLMKVGDGKSTVPNLPFVKFDSQYTKIQSPKIDTSTSYTYNGSVQSPTIIGYDPDKMILGGELSATSAGTYVITVTPQDNYCWSNGSVGSKTLQWEIKKATPDVTIVGGTTITLTEPLTDVYVDFNFNDNSLPSPVYSVTSSNPDIVTAKQSGFTKIKLTPSTTTGTANVAIVMEFGRNYETKSFMLTVTNNAAVSTTLNNNTWQVISKIAASGNASSYWSVGDCIAVKVKGTVGTLSVDDTYYVYIIGFNHDSTGIDFGTFKTASTDGISIALVNGYNSSYSSGDKYFNMFHGSIITASGCWKSCDMRYDILGSTNSFGASIAPETTPTSPVPDTLMAALPVELRAVMKPIRVSVPAVNAQIVEVCHDYLPLLAIPELGISSSYVASGEKSACTTYEYYSNGNSKVKYQHSSTGSTCLYWTRSRYYIASTQFLYTNGSTAAYKSGIYSYGVAPIFRV